MSVVRVGVIVGTEIARVGAWQVPAAVLPSSYTDSIDAAGAMPVAFPVTAGLVEQSERLLDLVDAVVLAGGRDVDPVWYDAPRHHRTESSDSLRDEVELSVVRAALARDVPVLGICRGMQVLNVALGGTIDQHLPDRLGHDQHAPAPGAFGQHDIAITPGSRIARAYGHASAATVHTYHHQGVDALGRGVVATAYSVPDEVVEAIESTAHAFAVGVQWHPEQDETTPLFAALVHHAREHH